MRDGPERERGMSASALSSATKPVSRGWWTTALVVNIALVMLAFFLMTARRHAGPSSYPTLTVVNASSEPLQVTPMAAGPAHPRRTGHWRGRGERGMFLIEQGERRPGSRVGRFEVAPGATWSIRFGADWEPLGYVAVVGQDGRLRIVHPAPRENYFDPVRVQIDDVSAIPEAAPEESQWYAEIPADLGFDWFGPVLWLPLLNLPWVVWMWWRARRGVLAAPSPTGL